MDHLRRFELHIEDVLDIFQDFVDEFEVVEGEAKPGICSFYWKSIMQHYKIGIEYWTLGENYTTVISVTRKSDLMREYLEKNILPRIHAMGVTASLQEFKSGTFGGYGFEFEILIRKSYS